MSREAWNPGRAWTLAVIAAALLLLGWPRGPAGIVPLPRCALRIELRGAGGPAELVCVEPGADARTALEAESDGCTLPAAYRPRDGDRLVARSAAGACELRLGRMAGAALLALGLPIDVNSASAEDLQALPGIGPVLAGRISERAREHPFADPAELTAVRGIGPGKLARVQPLIIVGPVQAEAPKTVDTPAPRM